MATDGASNFCKKSRGAVLKNSMLFILCALKPLLRNFLFSIVITPYGSSFMWHSSPADSSMLRSLSWPHLAFIQYMFVQTVLSAPYSTMRNFTSSHLNILADGPSNNITVLVDDPGIRYHVPNTLTTLYFHLGFPCKSTGMRSTINSARDYCEQQLEQEGDVPLPRSEEPFHEDLGYGAAIEVASSRPDHRLTWSILEDAMNGLWDFLVIEDRSVESEFYIHHGALGLVGRGIIREAPKTGLARRTRKRELGT